jgi:hypothetical protein
MNEESKDTARCCLPECANSPMRHADPVGSAYCVKLKLHWKSGHKIGCKRKGRVDFALFNIPRIAKSLMPADNGPSTEV